MTPEELRALRDQVLEQLRAEVRSGALVGPIAVSPDRSCEAFGYSRATFDRWLADPREGLEERPDPVVLRPNGPGSKVLVHLARMEAWLGRRARRRSG